MNTRNLFALMLAAAPLMCTAQSMFPVQLKAVEEANPMLSAGSAVARATAQDALTGLSLPNPEVEVSYMLGAEKETSNRTNITVSQTFDFATLSGAKRKVGEAEGAVAQAAFGSQRAATLLEAETAFVNYVYQSKLVEELQRQHDRIHSMHELAGKALEKGVINRLEYNRVELESFAADGELATARVELEALARSLRALAPDRDMELPTQWPQASLPTSFETWVQTAMQANPELKGLEAELARTDAEINLRRKENLPEFSVGYTGEIERGTHLNGAVISLSVPLWAGRGRVKGMQAQANAQRMMLDSARSQFLLTKRAQWEKARSLETYATDMQKLFESISQTNQAYLLKALDSGLITTLEYMTEQEDFYSHALKCLEARRDFLLARAALYAETL